MAKEVCMDIIISNSSSKPIYEQIISQMKGLILSGAIAAGDALPSIRFLAKELRISVITTKRAYEELEQEGFIVTIPGKGSFVSEKNTEFVREEQLRKINRFIATFQLRSRSALLFFDRFFLLYSSKRSPYVVISERFSLSFPSKAKGIQKKYY